jgi:guanylate kinase
MSGLKSRKGVRGVARIIIVSGPSGVGKSTICKEVVKRLKDVGLSVSVTTRPKGKNEVDGQDYWFVSKEQFQQRIENNMLLEYAEVFGNLYGTPKDKVQEALEAGKSVILEIDIQGGRQVKAKCPGAVMVFILPPSQKELAGRLDHRGREDAAKAAERLSKANMEIAVAKQCYEYMVVNDDLERAINKVVEIIQESIGE